MDIKKNVSLKNFNTFRIDVRAKYFLQLNNLNQILENSKHIRKEKVLILGGGSNTLLLNDWDGIVLVPNFKGKSIINETQEYIDIKVKSGEIWDKFVRWSVRYDYAGIENLVMIPGSVGGAVSQNISAYGQNISDTLINVDTINLETNEEKSFSPSECGYEYRRSNFKNIWRNKILITSATFRLKKHTKQFELSYHERAGRYGSILEELQSFAKEPYSINDVMRAIERQRGKRLPDVDKLGTCGSFFENPIVSKKKYLELSKRIPDLQAYPVENLSYKNDFSKEDEYVKIPAGRLLDELGWKGKWEGNVGVYDKHALCVVTNMKATGIEVKEFSDKMREDVKKNFDVDLIPEVNIF
ncbi:MAG TPA: UDP-N-acetylmuramate dehydrogenase [Candidatus Dojkabacteria bacterium]|nr:UDP-N-acetylmuramate dehydrogenase [Candidatus Dojkabacteria bacterium]